MPVRVVEPIPKNSTRSALADWLELSALSSDRKQVSEADLIGLHELYGGDSVATLRSETETGEVLDESILETMQEQSLQAVVEEIMYRAEVLQGCYPFKVKPRGILLAESTGEEQLTIGEWVYLFCLLSSAIREGGLQTTDESIETRIASLFQVCACLAAVGYLSGTASSFGFPRAQGNAFLPALQLAYKEFGEGTVRSDDNVPPGFPSDLKDGGIDVIAWRDFPDKLPGKLYLLGQCASGKNWKSKPVRTYIKSFHGNWFTGTPASEPIEALFIPFTFHHELQDSDEEDFSTRRRNAFHYETRTFGVIHDRFRLAYFAGLGSSLPPQNQGAFNENIDKVKAWVGDVLALMRGN